MRFSAKRIAALAVLLALASIIFLVESLLPPLLPIAPYVKLGLANAIVLFVIAVFGVRDAFIVVIAKNLLTLLILGQTYAFIFNLAGSLSACLIMTALYTVFYPRISLIAISVAGAVLSNIARTAVAVAIMDAKSLYVQLPAVSIFGVFAGIVVGVLTILLIKYLPERLTNPQNKD